MELEFDKTAQSLGLPQETLDRWIRQGRIPVHKQGAFCVFSRSKVEKWAAQRKLTFDLQDATVPGTKQLSPESLVAAMQYGGAMYDVAGDDAHSALTTAVDLLAIVPAEFKEELLERLIAREALSSTGIGKGVAIPHPRTPLTEALETPAIVTCFLKKPIGFGAIDDRPVFAMFLILCPDVKIHLHLLSRLAYCLRSDAFVAFLEKAPEPEKLQAKIAEFEAQLDGKDGP